MERALPLAPSTKPKDMNMATTQAEPRNTGNAYNLFILVLTLLSLGVMVALLMPLSEPTRVLLMFYDNFICVIFLIDFFLTLKAEPRKSDYFIKKRGWLDLLGSIPSLGFLKYSGLFRLARLSRFARIVRLLRGENRKQLARDILVHRNSYAGFITIALTLLVLVIASVFVLQFESQSPDASIKSGWDALWYAIVTITTVGYGDYYPVTMGGRITAMFIMFAGVGIIGALASILASLLVGPSSTPDAEKAPDEQSDLSVVKELEAIRKELSDLKKMIENKIT
jgi:voltage-gated potassium channel